MRHNTLNIQWECRECERITTVEVVMPTPAQTYGPPEKCYPAESGEITPEECDCGKAIDYDRAIEQAAELLNCQAEAEAEAKADAWEEMRKERR